MKKLMLALATTSLFASISVSNAQAYTDTYNLTVSGSVSAAPCKVATTGTDKQGNLDFGRLYAQDFSGAGSEATAKSKTLKVRLLNCALSTNGGATAITTADLVVDATAGATGSTTNWDVNLSGVGMKLEILGKSVNNPGVIAADQRNEYRIAIADNEDTEFSLKGTLVQIGNDLPQGDISQTIPLHIVYN